MQIVKEAGEVSELLTTYFRDKSVLKGYSMGIMALAIESILLSMIQSYNNDIYDESAYDKLSEDFRQKLIGAHEDVKTSENYSKAHGYGQGDTKHPSDKK